MTSSQTEWWERPLVGFRLPWEWSPVAWVDTLPMEMPRDHMLMRERSREMTLLRETLTGGRVARELASGCRWVESSSPIVFTLTILLGWRRFGLGRTRRTPKRMWARRESKALKLHDVSRRTKPRTRTMSCKRSERQKSLSENETRVSDLQMRCDDSELVRDG